MGKRKIIFRRMKFFTLFLYLSVGVIFSQVPPLSTQEEEIAEPSSYGILNDALNEVNVLNDWRGIYLKKYGQNADGFK